jgi:hypothetical protein
MIRSTPEIPAAAVNAPVTGLRGTMAAFAIVWFKR